ncbi:MAG: ribonuclease P protein component [Hyphomonadaceae bacterium]|nr:ribonuclease P protein component [Clostridia bacterium]
MQKIKTHNGNMTFSLIYGKGRSFVGSYVVLYRYPNQTDQNRVGITATKKIGKAVVRNRVRRLIKENYRALAPRLKKGYDFVFVARMRTVGARYQDIGGNMKALLLKANMFSQENKE